MSAKCYTAPVIPWNWVVETLANIKQLDVSTLIDLVKRTPGISDDLGKDAREVVSFRILESLFVHGDGTTIDADSPQGTKIRFDPTESCENVLRRILHEQTQTSGIKQKWDVHLFLAHKKSCLPKCGLQRLKESFHKGSYPFLANLKERSGLVVANEFGTRTPIVEDEFNGQTVVAKENLTSLNPEIRGNEFQGSSLNRNLINAKRVRNSSATEVSGEQSHKTQVTNDSDPHLSEANPAKKHKQDAICRIQTMDQNSVLLQRTELLKNSAGEIVQHTGTVECCLSIEPSVEGLVRSMLAYNSHYGYLASKNLGQRLVNCNDNKVPQGKSREGQDQRVSLDDSEHESEGCKDSVQPNSLNVGPPGKARCNMEHEWEPEKCRDSNRNDEERTDIATKTHAFLSSQCSLNEDPLAISDWTEVNLCIKCHEGGQMLICSSDACSIGVHQSCLGPAATFDGNEIFYCPFCVYSQAISKYLEAKRKASLARKNLEDFIGFGVKGGPKKFPERSSGLVQNQLREDEDLDDNNEANKGNHVNTAINSQWISNNAALELIEPSESLLNDDPPHGEREAAVMDGSKCGLIENELEGQKSGQECQSPRVMKEQQNAAQAAPDFEPNIASSGGRENRLGSNKHAGIQIQSRVLDDYSPCREEGTSLVNGTTVGFTSNAQEGKMKSQECQCPRGVGEQNIAVQDIYSCEPNASSSKGEEIRLESMKYAETQTNNGLQNQAVGDLCHEPVCPPTSPTEKGSKEENLKSVASSYSRRINQAKPQYKYPSMPQIRRNRIRWTEMEEEILKEGMQKFSRTDDTNIPWKKILDFGRDVFHKSRTATDLKDKWRNICKASRTSK